MGLKSSGQDILAWRIWILEVKPFDEFSALCELWHFRFIECFSIVACQPPILWHLWIPSEGLGSYSRLPHLGVFTLELHSFSFFLFLQFDYSTIHSGIQSSSETDKWFMRSSQHDKWSHIMLFGENSSRNKPFNFSIHVWSKWTFQVYNVSHGSRLRKKG